MGKPTMNGEPLEFTVGLRLPASTYARVLELAIAHDRPLSWTVRRIVKEHLIDEGRGIDTRSKEAVA